MAPIVKDSDAAVSAATPNSQAAPAAKPAGEAAARVQPVALEVPVTINGARTMEGSDKREPFSESTQTVLVFPQGAVIRLAASLAPGQLVFLTNEKTKKEVVCQVVKSKNYRTVTGYVELEFTEAASGFWGMRFPTVATTPSTSATGAPRPAATPAAVAPTTPKPAVQPTQNVAPAKPAVPPAPVIKPAAQTTPVAARSIAPPAAPPRPVVPQVPQVQSAPPATTQMPPAVAHRTEPRTDTKSQLPAGTNASTAPALPLPAIPDISDFLTAAPGSAVPLKPEKQHEQPSATSTEELKQHAAKLQEQLSTMLFSEKPKAQTPASIVPPAAEKEPAIVETAKVLELADLAPKRPAIPAPPAPVSKVTPIVHKSTTSSSFDAEHVQIPAWLAPLANNTETKSPSSSLTHESTAHSDPASSETHQEEVSAVSLSANTSHSIQSEMFGGQLLDDSSASTSESSGKSKKGLFIGVAAALLIAGGAFWYSQQPGNVLTGKAPALPQSTTAAASPSTPFANESTAKPQSSAPAANTAPNSSTPPASPSLTPAKQTTLPEANASVSSNSLTPAATKQPSERTRAIPVEPPPAPEPKKPIVGNVRLAKPVINGGNSARENGESALSIEVNQPANGENLSSLGSAHAKGPVAPLPVGGDVKPAQLIKSVPPLYPTLAKTQHISGSVKIDALIDASGNVSSMTVISGPAMLHQAALSAVKQWRYQPAELDGKPTSMHLTVMVQFRLQ